MRIARNLDLIFLAVTLPLFLALGLADPRLGHGRRRLARAARPARLPASRASKTDDPR